MRRVAVAGAGVTGLAAAIALRRHGFDVDVHESSPHAGGMIRPFRFRGVDCDLGSHRFHADALSEPLLRELRGRIDLRERPRRGRIVLGGRHIPYPLTLPGLLRGLGGRHALRMCADLALARAAGRRLSAWDGERWTSSADDDGYERFVIRRVGRGAYERFYRPYAEKVWGLDPAELSQTVAKKRVSTARPLEQLASAVLPARSPTFLYPQGGLGALVAGLTELATAAGVRFRFGTERLDADADVVVYTGDLRRLAPETRLTHRGLYLLYLAIDAPRVSDVDTWYLPERGTWFGRVSEVGNFRGDAQGRESVLCVEIPEGRWGPDQDFRAQVPEIEAQLRAAGILQKGHRVVDSAQHVVRGVYPMYVRGWRAEWERTMAGVVASNRVLPAGRQGLFLHCNMDHCLSIARAAADHLATGGTPATWLPLARRFLELGVRD